MTIQECVFAADYYLPVTADEHRAVYRIAEVKRCWPEPYRRERKQPPVNMAVLLDPNRNSQIAVKVENVRPADPERFRESWEAYQKNYENKK